MRSPEEKSAGGRDRPANLVLIGLRGSGKSTLGRRAARCLGLCFVDTDAIVEQQEGMKIRRIFEKKGEGYFRDAEARVVRSLEGSRGCVIAVGGGAPCREENRGILTSLGAVVWLIASPDTTVKRIRHRYRPPLTNLPLEDEVRTVLDERIDFYATMADHIVVTEGKGKEEAVHELEHVWRRLQDHDVR